MQGQPTPTASAAHRGPMTVRQVAEIYAKHAKDRARSRAFEDQVRYLRLFAEAHGDLSVADCLPAHLELWLGEHPEWKSDWTVRRVIGAIQRPFNWATRLRLISANPFVGVTHPQGMPGLPMDEEHYRALLRTTSAVFRRVLLFMRRTGARPGEMAAAEWGMLDVGRSVLVLPTHKTIRTQRHKKPRVLVLDPVVIKLLIWIRRHGPHPRLIFQTKRGTQWNHCNLSLRMRRLREKLGIPATCKLHGLRHRFGTAAVLNGVDLKTLAELMGHTSTRMTEWYVHIAGRTDHLLDAVRRVNGHYENSPPRRDS